MKRDMYRWLEEQKNLPSKKPMPVLSFPGIQILGIGVRELVGKGELQAECMKAIADRYDTAAALSNMDLSVEAEAFGAKIAFSDSEVPTVTGRLVDTDEDAQALKVPAIGAGRTGECVKAIGLAAGMIVDRPIFAGVIGPFSLAGRLMEMTEIMIKSLVEPETVHKVLDKTTEFLIGYLRALKAAGANGAIMAEPAAGLLSPALCAEFSSACIKRIIEAVEDESFIVIYHNCGNTAPLVEAILSTGVRAISLGNAVKLPEVIGKYPREKLIFGNLDPVGAFRHGNPESIALATRILLEAMDHRPNWIISSGCDIPPMTPLANIDAFFKAVRGYSEN